MICFVVYTIILLSYQLLGVNSLKKDSVIIYLCIKWCTLITLNTLLPFLLHIFPSSLVFHILLLSQYSHTWLKTRLPWLCKFGLFHLTWYLKFYSFSWIWDDFLLYSQIKFHLCIYTTFKNNSHIYGYSGPVYSLSIVNSASVNIDI